MATAPFTIDESLPGDSDIVSQHPANARTFRDVVEDYLNTDHDFNTGGHDKLSLVDQSSTPTFASGVVGIWQEDGTIYTRTGSGTVSGLLPPGLILPYAGSSAPEGWLLSYGQAISRTTYAALFAAIGTTYGSGDGSTTFNVPDLRGRAVAGQDDMGGTSANRLTDQTGGVNGDALGDTGGEETHALTEAELAAHTHDPGSLGFDAFTVVTDVNKVTTQGGGGASRVDNADKDAVTLNAGTSASTGSGTAHNNVQPTIILNYIIKV